MKLVFLLEVTQLSEFKIYKNGEFTVMSNYHLRDSRLSLKAVGLMSKMLSLPPDWDFSLAGLVAICKEEKDAVRNTLNELKCNNYIEILKMRSHKGTFQYKYLIFENPSEKDFIMRNKPDMENPYLDGPNVEYHTQYNINKFNNNNLIDKIDKEDFARYSKEKIFLTKELINLKYIDTNDEVSSFYFESLFFDLLKQGRSYNELLGSIYYIVPKIVNRKFLDEEGSQIKDKRLYFKSALKRNLQKLDEINNTQDDDKDFWDDFELDLGGGDRDV